MKRSTLIPRSCENIWRKKNRGRGGRQGKGFFRIEKKHELSFLKVTAYIVWFSKNNRKRAQWAARQ